MGRHVRTPARHLAPRQPRHKRTLADVVDALVRFTARLYVSDSQWRSL